MPGREEVREENFEDRMAHRRKDGEAYNLQKKIPGRVSLPGDFFCKNSSRLQKLPQDSAGKIGSSRRLVWEDASPWKTDSVTQEGLAPCGSWNKNSSPEKRPTSFAGFATTPITILSLLESIEDSDNCTTGGWTEPPAVT
jgi:hypothetical protein